MRQRRATDNCIAKKLWEKYTPYQQIIGFVTVAFPIIWICFSFVYDAQADHGRISALEDKVDKLTRAIDRIEDIAEFMGVPPRREQ